MAADLQLPARSRTTSSEDAIPDEDTTEVTRLFSERLRAWKHAVAYLEEYIEATEKMQQAHGKEYEKVLKTVSRPLREAEHFDQAVGGVSGLFENIRSNTQGISNSHYETAKTLKGTVLPIFERLHSEIKNKNKELTKGAGKGSKAVDKARQASQKHIELLSQNSATFDSTGGKVSAHEDPYVLRRGVMHRLNKQIIEENNNRQDLIAVQNSFAQFEAHVLQVIQSGLSQFNQVIQAQHDQTKTMYCDILGTAQRIPLDFEWNGFIKRNSQILIDPSAPPRNINNVSFANMGHRATQPLIAGSLDKKGKVLKRYDTYYYVITPSKYLHEFKTDDDFAKDPQAEMSLYLPDCIVGAIDGQKFNVKGKDVSHGTVGKHFAMTHELAFKAHTAADAQKWWEILRGAAGQTSNEAPSPSAPTSPTIEFKKQPAPLQTEGLQRAGTAGTSSATPYSAPTSAAPASGVATADSTPMSAAPKSATSAYGADAKQY